MASSSTLARHSCDRERKGGSAACASVVHTPHRPYIGNGSGHKSINALVGKKSMFLRGEGVVARRKASAEIAATDRTQRTCRVYADSKFVGFTQSISAPVQPQTKPVTAGNVVGLGQAMVGPSLMLWS